jgi:integrase
MATKYRNVREKDGKYYFRYSVKNAETGTRKQKEAGPFVSAIEAYNEGIKIKARILNGIYIEEKKITFSDFAKQWIELYKATDVKENTVYLRESVIKSAEKKFGGLYMSEITAAQYQEELNKMKKEDKKSKNTISNFHAVMKMIFQKALELEVVSKDITQFAKVPSFKNTVEELESFEELPEFLEKEQLATLLKTAREYGSPQGFRILFILAHTGMRLGELCSLKLNDIDKFKKRITVTKTLYVKGSLKKHVLNTPKNKSSIRKIDVSQRVISVFNEQIAWRNEFKMGYRKWFDDRSEFIFVDEGSCSGLPIRPSEVRKYMSEVINLAKLPPSITPHSLRHTYTSLMAESGVGITEIQNMLGHKNDKTTENIYLHVTESKKRAAVEKLDALMDGLF